MYFMMMRRPSPVALVDELISLFSYLLWRRDIILNPENLARLAPCSQLDTRDNPFEHLK